jgi:hypothetical protein
MPVKLFLGLTNVVDARILGAISALNSSLSRISFHLECGIRKRDITACATIKQSLARISFCTYFRAFGLLPTKGQFLNSLNSSGAKSQVIGQDLICSCFSSFQMVTQRTWFSRLSGTLGHTVRITHRTKLSIAFGYRSWIQVL